MSSCVAVKIYFLGVALMMNIIFSAVSVIIAFAALVFSVHCLSYTKLTISAAYRSEVFAWFSKTAETMQKIMHCKNNADLRMQLLGKLSALANEGRFYFPNTRLNNSNNAQFGGLRNYVIDFIVLFYAMYKNCENVEESDADKLYRRYTSTVYEFLKPINFINTLEAKIRESYKDIKPREKIPEVNALIINIADKYKVWGEI